ARRGAADRGEYRQAAGAVAPAIRPDADGERLKENPRRWRRRGVRSENYDEAHTSYRQWRLAIKPILWAGVTSDCARTPVFPAALVCRGTACKLILSPDGGRERQNKLRRKD